MEVSVRLCQGCWQFTEVNAYGKKFYCDDCYWLYVPGEYNGYRRAQYLRNTPYPTVTAWYQAMIEVIPEEERCKACSGSGKDVIYASNGGVGEITRCWSCQGNGRKVNA